MDPRLEKWVRRLMVVTVLAVAIFAAIQSYTHNFDLAMAHHESGASLRLLPLSVDWLMLAAGLVLLIESHKGAKPKLPKFVLWVGIAATAAGNIGALWIYGPVATLIGAWGPLCLVLTIEMGMHLVRSLSSAKPEEAAALPPWYRGVDLTDPEAVTEAERKMAELPVKPRPQAPEAVMSPGDSLQGWGQLGALPGAEPGLTGIGLAPRRP